MYLVYTDETGTNFSEPSPYLLYGGLNMADFLLFVLRKVIEVNNEAKKADEKLIELANRLDSSLLYSISNNDLHICKLDETKNDVICFGDFERFKNLCQKI